MGRKKIKEVVPKKSTVIGFVDYLTIEDVMAMFGVTYMTVYNWRTSLGLPYTEIVLSPKRCLIRFKKSKVTAWAKKNNRTELEATD